MIQIKKEDIGKHFVRCMNRGGTDIIIIIISVLEMRRLKLREVLGLESRSEILSPGSLFSLNALVVTKAWCREKLGLVMEGLSLYASSGPMYVPLQVLEHKASQMLGNALKTRIYSWGSCFRATVVVFNLGIIFCF